MPRRKTLETVTERLGKQYDRWKKYEGKKDEEKLDFFELATAQESAKTLATQRVVLSRPLSEEDARAYLAKYYPRWNIATLGYSDGNITRALLVEDPKLKTTSFVNPRDGRVYTRQVDNGPAMLDDERLLAEDPDLYAKVTIKTPWGDPVLWPLDQLPDATLAQVQKYIYTGKPRVKLAAPRKAKPEELTDADL